MTKPHDNNPTRNLDEELRLRVFERVRAMNKSVLAQLSTVADDLESGAHRAALGGLEGLEQRIGAMRSLLLLLP
jgi:hypothetical protein